MRKVFGEICALVIAYVIVSVYAYFNTDVKGWSWLINAILVPAVYGIIKISEYLHKRKSNSKKEPPQSER